MTVIMRFFIPLNLFSKSL